MKINRKLSAKSFLFPIVLFGSFWGQITFAASGPNLIQNPSLETVSSNSSATPSQWLTGKWGTNSTVFTYPAAGINGKAAKVSMSSYVNGDAKWYFADVPVTAGQTYKFQDSYLGTVGSKLVVRYTKAGNAVSYDDIGNLLAASSSWQGASAIITPPAGTVSLTVFHILAGVGSLTIDDVSLSLQTADPNPTPTSTPGTLDQGFVSLSFDDGFLSQFNKAKPILDNAGIKGTFYIITHVVSGIVPLNPSFEIDADQNNIPDNWSTSKTGNNKVTFTYPATGVNGGKSAQIVVSSYRTGDAKWIFDDVSVLTDHIYTYQDQYKSTAQSVVTARITKTDNTVQTVQIATTGSSNKWKSFSGDFYVPVNAKSVTVYRALISNGTLAIDDASLGISSYITKANVLSLQSSGHEIAAHSQTHPDLATLSLGQIQTEIVGSRNELISIGAVPALSFAYPYGSTNAQVKQVVHDAGMTSARTVIEGLNNKSTDKFSLFGYPVTASTTLNQVKVQIDNAVANKGWLVLIFHGIEGNTSPDTIPTTLLQGIVDYIKTKNVPSHTIVEGTSLISS